MSDDDIVFVVNRSSAKYEGMFDGKVYEFAPNERKPLQANKARNLVAGSYQSLGLTTGVPAGYRLGIEGESECTPIGAPQERVELLDRSKMETLQHSKPQVLTQRGLEPITAEVGVSPVSTPVTAAIVREASDKKGKKKVEPTVKALEFDNPTPRHGGGMGSGSVTSVNK